MLKRPVQLESSSDKAIEEILSPRKSESYDRTCNRDKKRDSKLRSSTTYHSCSSKLRLKYVKDEKEGNLILD